MNRRAFLGAISAGLAFLGLTPQTGEAQTWHWSVQHTPHMARASVWRTAGGRTVSLINCDFLDISPLAIINGLCSIEAAARADGYQWPSSHRARLGEALLVISRGHG